jgi:hypothetical protein
MMCVRASVTPKEKKQMVTNKLWDGAKPELLDGARGMDVVDELVFLNHEYRRLGDVCSEYRKEIDLYEEIVDDYRGFLYSLLKKTKAMDWSPATQQIIESITDKLQFDEQG